MGVIRKTKSLDILLGQFEVEARAISAISLVQRLKDQLNKTTIYRLLERLEDDGVLHSFLGNDGEKWYARCTGCSSESHVDHHPHFQCMECGKVDCLSMEITIPSISNREIIGSQILIKGKCETCSA